MKRSYFVTGLLLAAVIAVGIWNAQRLKTLQIQHAEILTAAARAGVPDVQSPTKSSIRLRDDAELQRALSECRVVISTGKNWTDQIQQIASGLSASSLRKLATAICEDATLSTEQKGRVFDSLMEYAAEESPEVVMEIAMSHPELFFIHIEGGMNLRTFYSVGTALEVFAADDWENALEMTLRLKEKSPEIIASLEELDLNKYVAKLPPQRLFEWSRQMERIPRDDVLGSYFSSAKTRGQQTEKMAALRQYLDNMVSGTDRNLAKHFAFSNMAKAAAASGYEFGSGWMASVDPSANEAGKFMNQLLLEPSSTAEMGRWIEWMNEKFPEGLPSFDTSEMVQKWSDKDYQAAGKWLASQPAGNIKNQAITGYIESVKNLDPAVAKQWALTLPPGPEREKTLQRLQAK